MTTYTYGVGTYGSPIHMYGGGQIAPTEEIERTVVHAPSYSADASHLTSISKPGVHSSAARTVVYQPTYDRQGTP